jgi:hypothetical protein
MLELPDDPDGDDSDAAAAGLDVKLVAGFVGNGAAPHQRGIRLRFLPSAVLLTISWTGLWLLPVYWTPTEFGYLTHRAADASPYNEARWAVPI